MKNKLIIIFLFCSLIAFGQSVPNTTTFTLQNVVDAVNPTTNDLVDCFNDANAAYFNPTYGSKTMDPKTLLGFRDYKPSSTPLYCITSASGAFSEVSNTIYSQTPSGTQSGDLIVLIQITAANVTHITPSGFTHEFTESNGDLLYSIYHKIATGLETLLTFQNTLPSNGGAAYGVQMYRITGGATLYGTTGNYSAFNVSSYTQSNNITSTFGIRICAGIYTSTPAITPDITGGDYTVSATVNLSNTLYIKAACASTGTKSITWSGSQASKFCSVLILIN